VRKGEGGGRRIIVSGFESFHRDPLDFELLQFFCPGTGQPPKLEEFQATKGGEDNPFDWLLGVGDKASSSIDASWKLHREGENSPYHLTIQPPPKRDFWRKTYYEPVLVKDDAPFLFCTVPRNQHYTVTAAFQLDAVSQFDQAGLMIRLSSQHWLKTGIEVVDGLPLLSCVVTNMYSDWSTQPFAEKAAPKKKKHPAAADASSSSWNAAAVHVPECRIRVHCRGTNFVVQAVMDGVWRMIRIAHLSVHQQCLPDPLEKHKSENEGPSPGHQEMWVGVFAACPVEQKGCRVTFTEFEVREGSDFDHSAE